MAALEQSAAIVEGKVTPALAGMLDSIKDEKKASLAVADPKLGTCDTLNILEPDLTDFQPMPSTNCRNCLSTSSPILPPLIFTEPFATISRH